MGEPVDRVRHMPAVEPNLARHQQEGEKPGHPLNPIISVDEDAEGLMVNTTDIHLPRRIGEAVKRAFHGEAEAKFDEDGCFVRVEWTPAG